MEADFSGFYSGVKEVLVGRKSGKLTGINGAVAELEPLIIIILKQSKQHLAARCNISLLLQKQMQEKLLAI